MTKEYKKRVMDLYIVLYRTGNLHLFKEMLPYV